ERQMRALASAGWRSLPLAEFAARVAAPGEAPAASGGREFLLTFDDGYADLATHAYPVLAELGFTATTFLITDFVGRTNTWDARYTWRRLVHLGWDAVTAWGARGFDFASHGATHRRLTWLDETAIADELTRSRETLVRHLGPAAGRAVAYPFGAVDARVLHLAADAGYELGFGGVRGTGDPYALPRVPVYVWDAGRLPLGLRRDALGRAGRVVAHLANRCAVITTVLRAGSRGPTDPRRPPPPSPSRGSPCPRRSWLP
ncbi:MAG TPA: polysaccharide deacetylase family protein, partial [Gemmatimonadales bacterium]|nr:polysaccharide deacetylase family protein [Gemmatimonadales bacterium]